MAETERPAVVAEMVSDMAACAERWEEIAAAARPAMEVAAARVRTVSEALAGREETAVTERRSVAMFNMPVAPGCVVAAATAGQAELVEMHGEGVEATEAAGVTA
jgi:hypothetical protein